jgi:hypothetical protein
MIFLKNKKMKITILFLALASIISCQNLPKTAGSANEKLVKNYFSYFNKHDFKSLAAMYADTTLFKDPSLGKGIVMQTRQQTINKYIELAKVFPNLHDELLQTYQSAGNYIIVEFISTGTGSDGVKFELPICTIFTIENGLITKDFTYFDNFEE